MWGLSPVHPPVNTGTWPLAKHIDLWGSEAGPTGPGRPVSRPPADSPHLSQPHSSHKTGLNSTPMLSSHQMYICLFTQSVWSSWL